MANVWTDGSALAGTAANVHEVDPISRIEGHLGVKVVVDPATGKIVDANAHGNLWRGFENFLLGREVNDAITFVQRICGVCPVPHGLTSTYAVDTVLGYSKGHITFASATEGLQTWGVPAKAVLIRNLVAAVDTLMSSITHFYHLAAPSYIQGPAIPPWTPFFDNNYYHAALRNPGGTTAVPNLTAPHLWDAVIYSYVKALRIRRLTFEAGALFAGRMPMTSCFVGGGVTNDGTENLTDRVAKFRTIMQEVGKFIVQEYLPIALALGALYPEFDSQTDSLGTNRGSGAGLGRFLSWGAFPNLDDSLASVGGVFDTNVAAPATFPAVEDVTHFRVSDKADVYAKFLAGGTFSVPTNLTEDIVNSRYDRATIDTTSVAAGGTGAFVGASTVAYPGAVARTKPKRTAGYTYIKAPRWNGMACEVGPLARLVVAGTYPTDGSPLNAIPGYKEIYTLNGDGTGGLDARVIESTIALGLVADSLASLTGNSITGTAATFIVNLKGGLSTLDRLRARAIESLVLIQAVLGPVTKNATTGKPEFVHATAGWVNELDALTGGVGQDIVGSTWAPKRAQSSLGVVQGWGANEAARGALMHQTTIRNGRITKYQCIVPTTWNGSPKAGVANERGAIEEAMIGAHFFRSDGTVLGDDAAIDGKGGASFNSQTSTVAGTLPMVTNSISTEAGVEVLRIAQSFDPCIACAIH